MVLDFLQSHLDAIGVIVDLRYSYCRLCECQSVFSYGRRLHTLDNYRM